MKPPNEIYNADRLCSIESSPNIQDLINKADSFLKAEDIKKSAENYEEGQFFRIFSLKTPIILKTLEVL